MQQPHKHHACQHTDPHVFVHNCPCTLVSSCGSIIITLQARIHIYKYLAKQILFIFCSWTQYLSFNAVSHFGSLCHISSGVTIQIEWRYLNSKYLFHFWHSGMKYKKSRNVQNWMWNIIMAALEILQRFGLGTIKISYRVLVWSVMVVVHQASHCHHCAGGSGAFSLLWKNNIETVILRENFKRKFIFNKFSLTEK